MRQLSKIFSDITKSVSSSCVQFLITLVSTPLMTRLYDPSAYAAFGLINTMATTGVGIGLLSLPNAPAIEKDPVRRAELIQTMVLLLGALVILAVAAAIGMAVTDMFPIETMALALLPVLVFTAGVRQIMMSIATAHANFSSIALGQTLEPACSRLGSITLGATLGSHPAFILGSVIIGNVVAVATIWKMVLARARDEWRSLFRPRRQSLGILRHYAHFVSYYTLSQQAQPLLMLGIQMGIVALFSTQLAGQYMLAISILTLPVTLISLATARVVYRHFIEIEHTNPAKLTRHVLVAMMIYLVAGACILSPVFFFGEKIFAFAFGRNWAQAGLIASTLSFAYMGAFAVVGVQSIFMVTHRVRLQFWLEIGMCALTATAGIIALRSMDFTTLIRYLAVFWFLRNILLLHACVVVASRHRSLVNQVST